MAEGDSFLGFLKDTVNSIPIVGAYSYAAWGRGNYDPNPAPKPTDPGFAERAAEWVNVIPFAGVAGQATTWGTDNIAPMKWLLDFGMKTTDSFVSGFQYNDAMDDPSLSVWAEGWRKSWTSFGTTNHVSAGQLAGAALNETFDGQSDAGPLNDLNPFDQRGVAAINELSKRNWYGNIAGGVLDLTAPGLPYAGVGKVVRAARNASNINTLARAEATEAVFNKAADAGSLGDLSTQAGRSFVREVGGVPQSGESMAARLRDRARELLDHADDNTSALNYLAPRMETSNPQAQRFMMETAVYAKRFGPELGTEVIGNAWLTTLGSAKAAERLEQIAPALVDKIATVTGPPEVLSTFAKARATLVQNHLNGGDLGIEKIISDTMETPRKQRQLQIIKSELERAAEEATKARDVRTKIRNLKPQIRTKVDGKYVDDFDTARLKEARGKAEVQVRSIAEELKQAKAERARRSGEAKGLAQMSDAQQKGLTSKQALQDGADALKSKEGRDALAAFGPYKDAEYYAKEAGAGTARVSSSNEKIAEIERRLAEAKADRDLLASTPLNDPDAMNAWRTELSNSRANAKTATQRRDMLAALERTARRELADDRKIASMMGFKLQSTNDWLVDFAAAKQSGTSVSVGRSLLARTRTAWRDKVGETFMFQTGEYSPKAFIHRHPSEQMATIGTNYGRSAINVNDRYIGQQELGMYLRKSGVFGGDEIRDGVNAMLAANQRDVGNITEKLNSEMVTRMLVQEGLDPRAERNLMPAFNAGMHRNRKFMTKSVDEADAEGSPIARIIDSPADPGVTDAFDFAETPFLRSHLSDTIPFTDPKQVRDFIKARKNDAAWWDDLIRGGGAATDVFNHGWKLASIIRPGLFVRNMLDTGLRAAMLMGAAETLLTADRGAWNLTRNSGLRLHNWALKDNTMRGSALERIGIRQGKAGIIKHSLSDSTVSIDIGGGQKRKLALHELQDGHATAASQAALGMAMNKGVPVHEGIMGNNLTPFSRELTRSVEKYDMYKSFDARWPEAYQSHAQVMLASPTVRKMLNDDLVFDDGLSVDSPDARVRRIFSDPDVRDEYAQVAAARNATREEWIEAVDSEIKTMFPDPQMAKDVLSGRLKGKTARKWIEDNFPPEARFDVPGLESVLELNSKGAETLRSIFNRRMNQIFDILMDKPDNILVDNPTALAAYKSQARLEASNLLAARRKKFGDDVVLDEADIRKIDQRARTFAISTVRKYMYDATRHTEFSEAINRITPFFNPWFDSMRAYSKLAYDNPGYMGLAAVGWNAPQNLSIHMSNPLIVDADGQPVARGAEPERGGGERYIVLNSVIGGKQPFGLDLKIRQSSLNTILQGDTPWLPGWGPVMTMPLTPILNTNEDVALWASNTDNTLLKTFLKSLYPDGQIPRNDQVFDQLKPSHLRRLIDVAGGGEAYWQNVQYGVNGRKAHSIKTGEVFDEKRAWQEAMHDARAAGWISWLTQFGVGLSPQTDVIGRFYVNEMHAIQALPIETVKARGFPSHQAMFMDQFPEAANLTWTFTRNETGISATVRAQDRANQFRDLIDANPEAGFFVVGEDNIGGEFSQTAYNQQRANTYGLSMAGRKRLDPGEVNEKVQASFGWDEYARFMAELDRVTAEQALPTDAISFVKSEFTNWLGAKNIVWFKDYNERVKKLPIFFKQADEIARDPRMAERQDVGMYVEYRKARQEILDYFGMRSLDGTSEKAAVARSMLRDVGTQLASQNFGFQQTWDRMLSAEVEPKATDVRFLNDGAA